MHSVVCRPCISAEILAAELSCDEDESLTFGKHLSQHHVKFKPKYHHRRPIGVHNLDQWGCLVFPDGKHRGQEFLHVYVNDQPYCKWVMARTKPVSTWMKSFQHFLMAMENAKSKELERLELRSTSCRMKGQEANACSLSMPLLLPRLPLPLPRFLSSRFFT